MLIGNLPEDTSLSENGYVLYSEDGQHCSKMSIKNLNGGGAGLKYWKETDNTIYRVQHNEGQWLFDDHFKVPGAAEIIVGCTRWDFRGVDRDISMPILVGHVDPETGETYYIEEDGPEVAFLQDRIKHYYIFRRVSNKVVMGGTLWYKFWGQREDSRLPDEEYGGETRYKINLPGWLLMSTDKDTLTYQLVEIDPWSYGQMPVNIQERIDNGFFLYEHMADNTISTIAPLETPIVHPATGASFYINNMPDPEIYEPLVVGVNPTSQQVYYTKSEICYAYLPPSDASSSAHPYRDSINLFYAGDSYLDDIPRPVESTWPTSSSEECWNDWVMDYIKDPIDSNHSSYERKKTVKVASYDSKLQDYASPRRVGFPEKVMGPYLAYFGAVYNHSGISYSGTLSEHGKTAVEFPFHDGNILYPQGFFTGIATGFATRGLVFYAGTTTDEYDEPQVDQANVWIDSDGNIGGHSISVADQIISNGTPVIGSVTPVLTEGTEIARFYPTGMDTPITLYAPSGGGGGGGVNITRTVLFSNSKTSYARQVTEITLNDYIANYDIITVMLCDNYSNNGPYTYFNIIVKDFFGDSLIFTGNNGKSVKLAFVNYVTSYTVVPTYDGAAWIKRISGIKLS